MNEDKNVLEELEEAPEYACTVISLLPFELKEEKPHLLPNLFVVPAASEDGRELGLLYVKEAVHFVPNPLIEEGRPGSSIRQITTPMDMARSICDDYNCAHVALGDDAQPGLFWVAGKLNQTQIIKFHGKKLEAVRKKQKNWFRNLCIMADADWEKNHDMRAVSDLQRTAARSLGIQKDWVEFRVEETTKCPYCNSNISPEAAICANCREVVNPSKHAALKKQFDPGDLFSKKVEVPSAV